MEQNLLYIQKYFPGVKMKKQVRSGFKNEEVEMKNLFEMQKHLFYGRSYN